MEVKRGCVDSLIVFLNEDLLFLEFGSQKEARGVLEAGRRNCKGNFLQLDWWRLEARYISRKDIVKEAWIRVVGLPLPLWTPKTLKRIGDACGGFIALDKLTALRTEVLWARLLIKLTRNPRPSIINILEGGRYLELQIWWEIPPWLAKVYMVGSNVEAKIQNEEEDVGVRAALCGFFSSKSQGR